MPKIYQFQNSINNQQKPWKRYFAAFSLSDAKILAKDFEKRMNESNGFVAHLLFTFDYESVIIIETSKEYDRGYIELV